MVVLALGEFFDRHPVGGPICFVAVVIAVAWVLVTFIKHA